MCYTVKEFGELKDGQKIYAYTLCNKNGISATILNFGGILQSLLVPDKIGKLDDIVCGFDTVEDYLKDGQYFGSIVGRYANRIANGNFVLDGVNYHLNCNEQGIKHIHGGTVGYNRRVWDVNVYENNNTVTAELSLISPDGEENYPGTLNIKVRYVLSDDNSLKLIYDADTDKTTVINLTNHSYFNLAGYRSKSLLTQTIKVNADTYTEVDEKLIPTGRLLSVDGTKFDLRKEKPFVDDFDHNFVINGNTGDKKFAASMKDTVSGRKMDVYTDLPGIQIYSAINMCEDTKFKSGVEQEKHGACCFETQYFPDSPNHKNFPSCVLTPDSHYHSETEFRFSIEE